MIKVVLIDGELFEEWKGHKEPVNWELVWDHLFTFSSSLRYSWDEIDESVRNHVEILGRLAGKEKLAPIHAVASAGNFTVASTFYKAHVTKSYVSAYSVFPGLKNAKKARTLIKKRSTKKRP